MKVKLYLLLNFNAKFYSNITQLFALFRLPMSNDDENHQYNKQ